GYTKHHGSDRRNGGYETHRSSNRRNGGYETHRSRKPGQGPELVPLPKKLLNKPRTGRHKIASADFRNFSSADPNALIGPGAYGANNLIKPAGVWTYTVDFENDGSLAAQNVTVTQQFDANLDWSTFQLGSFGFGPVNVTVPAGLTQYQT